MKITFYGTSHGIPAPDRYCSCIEVNVGGKLYFIDAGAPLTDIMLHKGRNPNDIKAVFTTHAHGDHVDGLIPLCGICDWAFTQTDFDIFITEEKLRDMITDYVCFVAGSGKISPFPHDRIRFNLACAGKVYDDGTVKVSYIPNAHLSHSPTYSIAFEAEGKTVLFSGDLSIHLSKEDFPRFALENRTDLTVCELAHFGLDELEKYLAELKTEHLCINHVYPFDKFAQIEALNAAKKYPYPITVAHDGDEILL